MNESMLSEFWRNSLHHRSFVIGLILSFIMLFTGLLSLFWTPFPVELLDIPHKLESPSAKHWLGTDHFGRDVFSMLMVGAWNSMLVSVFAIGFGSLIGVPLGALAAAKRGWVEETAMQKMSLLVLKNWKNALETLQTLSCVIESLLLGNNSGKYLFSLNFWSRSREAEGLSNKP